MLCPKCQQANPDHARFCGSCGATLAAAPPPPRGQAARPPGATADEPVSSNLNIGIIVGTLFIPLLGIIMGVIYMQDANPAKKAAGKLWLQIGIGWAIASCVLAFVCATLGNA